MSRSETQSDTVYDFQRKKIDALRRDCCTFQQEISLLEIKSKRLIEHNAEIAAAIALLKTETVSKERELSSTQTVCSMKKDKINRLMQHTQMALMRKAEAETAYRQEAEKMNVKHKQADELLGKIREEVLNVTAILDNVPWVKARQKIILRIEELKRQVSTTDVVVQELEVELNMKSKIVDGHKKLPFHSFCKIAAMLALRIRSLFSKLAVELVAVDKLRKAQQSLESDQNSLSKDDQSIEFSGISNGQENTSLLSVESQLTCPERSNGVQSIGNDQLDEVRQEEALSSSVCNMEEVEKTEVERVRENVDFASKKHDELSTVDDNSLLKVLDGSESTEFAKEEPNDADISESVNSTLNVSNLEGSCFRSLNELSFNQSNDNVVNNFLGGIEGENASSEVFKVPSSPTRPSDGKKSSSKKGTIKDLLDFEKIDDSAVAHIFGNANRGSEFNISSLDSNVSNDFNPSALLDLSNAIHGTDTNMDFMSLFCGGKSGINGQDESAFSFDFNCLSDGDKNRDNKGLINEPFSLF